MNTPTDTSSEGRRLPASHEDWELRLQDWLDGIADADEARAVETHVARCATCTQLIADVRRIDERLMAEIPPEPGPGAQFDAQLFGRIDAEEAARERVRKAARTTAPAQELAELQRAWRKSLLRVGTIAVVLVAVAMWAVVSGVIPFLSPATIALAIASVTPVQWISIGLGGGAIALALTRWLQAN